MYGIQESINSNLERMFHATARRSVLEHGVGHTTSTAGADGREKLNAQQRECDAVVNFHAGKAVELSMQLIYAHGADRIMGREYPGVSEKDIKKDIKKGHDLKRLHDYILDQMAGKDMKNAFENAYQTALNRGLVDVTIDGKLAWTDFLTLEDIPFREQAQRGVSDGGEVTQDHVEHRDLLFGDQGPSEFQKMPFDTFAHFLTKADAAYYEGDIPDKLGNTGRKNMRWMDYSARDHEYGRPYTVAGVNFFARLAKELVSLANQQWMWHPDFGLRWWSRRKYNIGKLLDTHAKQNFQEEVKFPEMISPEDGWATVSSLHTDPATRVERGYTHLRSKRSWESAG